MKIVAISRVKNEIDIVEAFARHNVQHCDKLIVMDDGSTDGTYDVLRALQRSGLPLVVLRAPEVGYFQSRHMTRLFRIAVERFNADWVVPIDADEFLETPEGTRLDALLAPLAPGIYKMPWNNFVYPAEGDEGGPVNPVERLTHRMPPAGLWKVVVSVEAILDKDVELAQGNHDVYLDSEMVPAKPLDGVALCHFPIRSVDQYASKIALGYLQYAAMPRWRRRDQGFHYVVPFLELKADIAAFRERVSERSSRRYSLLPTVALAEAPSFSPLRYLGEPLAFTPRAGSGLLPNLLNYCEALAGAAGEARAEAEDERSATAAADERSLSIRKRAEEAEALVYSLDALRRQSIVETRELRTRERKANRRVKATNAARVKLKARAERLQRDLERRRSRSLGGLLRRLLGGGSKHAKRGKLPAALRPRPDRSGTRSEQLVKRPARLAGAAPPPRCCTPAQKLRGGTASPGPANRSCFLPAPAPMPERRGDQAMTTHSPDTSTQKFSDDRLAAFGRGDVAALVGQYLDDAVVITPQGTLSGPQIRGMIEGIVAEFAQPGVRFDLIARAAEGPIATFVWKAETGRNTYDLGSETYVLDGGRIAYQTFAAKVTPRGTSPGSSS